MTMKPQQLYDRNNRLIGRIKERSGKLEIFDGNNRYKGRYDPNTNTTWDSNNRKVGTGNLLTTLL